MSGVRVPPGWPPSVVEHALNSRWLCPRRTTDASMSVTVRVPLGTCSSDVYFSGIAFARSTGTAVTLFCGEPSITRSE